MAGEDKTQKLSPTQYLLASAGAGEYFSVLFSLIAWREC